MVLIITKYIAILCLMFDKYVYHQIDAFVIYGLVWEGTRVRLFLDERHELIDSSGQSVASAAEGLD